MSSGVLTVSTVPRVEDIIGIHLSGMSRPVPGPAHDGLHAGLFSPVIAGGDFISFGI
jgi:hypothetical protein